MVIFPEKCNNCPFIKCRVLHYFNEKGDGITSRDVKQFFESYLIPQGKPRDYDETTPRKILERLRKSHWLCRRFKESRKRREKGRLAWVHFFDKKAKDYLKKYKSFLVGPLCRKKIEKMEKKRKIAEPKLKLKEELIIFGEKDD
jgi:hypothetical protein